MLYTKQNDPLILTTCPFILAGVTDIKRTKNSCQECTGWFPWSIMTQLSDGTKLNRTRGQEKGVVSAKMKNFIHGFKFMLKLN